MKRELTATALAVAFIALLLSIQTVITAQVQGSAQAAFKAAMDKEVIDGDLKGAIKQYKAIAEGKDRALAAQALLRMANCYQQIGDRGEAQNVYRRIVQDYPEQKVAVAQAQQRLGIQSGARSTETSFRKVWSVGWPMDVSMDGRYVAHLVGQGGSQLLVRDLSTGTDRAVTSPQARIESTMTTATISRDGRRIAYDWCTRTCELRVSDILPSGVSKPQTFFAKEEVQFPYPLDWSPDGKSVAVLLARRDKSSQIGLVAVRDGTTSGLTSLGWSGTKGAFFSADGRWLAFDRAAGSDSEQRDVFIIAVDGSREIPAVVHRDNDEVAGWSPDGALLFTSNRNGGSVDLWSIGFRDGRILGSPEFIKSGIGDPLRVTKNGALFTTSEGGDRDIEIASVDFATGKQVAAPIRPIDSFIGANTTPTWSPDGSRLAYLRTGDPQLIAIRSEKTGEVREVHTTPLLPWMRGLSWWPDGASFAVLGRDDKGRQGIFRVDAGTGAVTLIGDYLKENETINYTGFSWSPDGRYMYFRGNGGLREHDLVLGTQRVITSPLRGYPSLSPDGRWVAASGQAARTLLLFAPATGEVRELLRLDSGETIFRYGRMPWTPDGKGIIVRKVLADSSKSELWRISTVGEPHVKLDIDANRIVDSLWGRIEVHPDGKRLALVTGETSTDVWILENFQPSKRSR